MSAEPEYAHADESVQRFRSNLLRHAVCFGGFSPYLALH
jgi:hypothetical protein